MSETTTIQQAQQPLPGEEPQWPAPPKPPEGFDNENTAQAQADLASANENDRNRKHVSGTVVPYYISYNAIKPHDTSGVYDHNGYRDDVFPVSAWRFMGISLKMSEHDGPGLSGYQYFVVPVKDAAGNNVPQFTREELDGMCQVEFEKQTGLSAHWTTRASKSMLDAAGIEVQTETVVNLSSTFGPKQDDGVYSFAGDRLQAEKIAPGTRAINPQDGVEYQFYRQDGGIMAQKLWVLPSIYVKWTEVG